MKARSFVGRHLSAHTQTASEEHKLLAQRGVFRKRNRSRCSCAWLVFSAFIVLCWQMFTAVEVSGQTSRSHLYSGGSLWHREAVPSQLNPSLLPNSSTNNKPRYTVVPIGPPPGKESSFVTLSRAVNNEGVVAGYAYNGTSQADQFLTSIPFLWRDGKLSELPLLSGWPAAFAFGVNDREQVVGSANKIDSNQNIIQTAVLWEHGKPLNIGASIAGAITSFASDVSNRGRVVGAYLDANQTEVPFTMFGGSLELLPLLPGMTDAEPGRINDFGVIVGQQLSATEIVPCLWYRTLNGYVAVNLGTFGGNIGVAVGINEFGLTVGYSTMADQHARAFVWFGLLQNLGTLPGDTDSLAYNINDKLQIVGLSGTATTTRTFLWHNGHMTDLHDLVPPDTPPFNDSVGQINDLGEIPVDTMHLDGSQAAFLLVPMGEK